MKMLAAAINATTRNKEIFVRHFGRSATGPKIRSEPSMAPESMGFPQPINE
jgi:hypothetical protein